MTSAGPIRRRWVARAVTITVLAALGVAAIFLPWADVLRTISQVHKGWFALSLLANLAVFPFWIWQWQCLTRPLRRIAWPVMAQVVALSIAAKVTVSGLGGVASGMAALHGKAGLSVIGAGSVMSVDQLLAGLAKLAVLAAALALVPLPPLVTDAALALAAACLTLMIALVAAVRLRGGLARGAGAGGLPGRLAAWVQHVTSDMTALAARGVLGPAVALALVKKAIEVIAALGIQMACGIEAPPAVAVLVVASVSLTTLLPLTPANLGPHSLAVYATYAAFDVPTALAISAGVLHHFTMLLASAIFVGTALAIGATRVRDVPGGRPDS